MINFLTPEERERHEKEHDEKKPVQQPQTAAETKTKILGVPLREQHKGILEWARAEVESAKGIQITFFVMHTWKEQPEAELCVAMVPYQSTLPLNERFDFVYTLGKTFASFDAKGMVEPQSIFSVSEAWMSRSKEVKPSQDPKREDVMVICGKDRYSNTMVSAYPFVAKNGQRALSPTAVYDSSSRSDDEPDTALLNEFWNGYYDLPTKCKELPMKVTVVGIRGPKSGHIADSITKAMEAKAKLERIQGSEGAGQ